MYTKQRQSKVVLRNRNKPLPVPLQPRVRRIYYTHINRDPPLYRNESREVTVACAFYLLKGDSF